MIPILYAPDESNFDHGGIGALFETTSCVVEEERNGAFEIEFKYPVDGHLYKYIEEGCIVKAKPNDTAEPQLFSIYRSTKPINGIVTFYGEHISYELSGNPVESVEVENAIAQDAIGRVLAAALLPHKYTAQSDITTPNSTSIARASVRAALGGVSGSILSVWGGEYEFDNFKIKLHSSRGTKTGIKIAYGKNLTDLQQEKNISEVYVGVYPYAKYTPQAAENATEQPEEVVVSLSEKIIWSPHAAAHARKRVCIKDFSDRFNGANEITEEQLREVVEAWVETSGFDVPAVSITVSFVHLWHSPEYAQYALLERVNLCDRVSVEFSKLGVSATAKVIKTKYDVLNEKYLSITLGSAKANFADTVNQTSAAIEQTKQEIKQSAAALGVDIKKAVDEATQAITGQSGGYVVLNPPKNPQEILIMDAPTIAAAKNIWRWNSGGFGHSKNGYNGPFGTAITQDGAIVADFITAGTLRAIEIAACTIKGGSLNINDKFIVTTEGDATVAGKVTATSGVIGGCEIVDGVLKIKNANISEKLTAGSIDVSGVIKAGGIAILGDVEAEAKRATEAEGALSTRITANADGIAAEIERATAYEGTLSSRITANAEAITAEVERATAYEGTLFSKITVNAEAISAEVERATAYEGTLSSRITATAEEISAEVTRAQGAESTLSSRISANAEEISAEVERAEGAESSLSSRISANAEEISAEVTRAQGAESTLSSRISANASAITAKVSSSGGSSSSFGWSLTSSGFYLYSGSTTVMKVTSSGLEVSGKITGSSGKIGNLNISDGGLVYGTVTNDVATGVKITTDTIWCKYGYYSSGSIGCWGFSSSGMSGSYSSVAGYNGQDVAYLRPETLGYKLYGISSVTTCRWQTIVDIINTASSDERVKNSIEELSDAYDLFFDALSPKRYKYNEGTSGRYHTGYIAQDVVAALDSAGLATSDFAAVMLEGAGSETECWKLRRDEFVALNTWQIQKLKARIAELEKQLST